MGKDAKGSAWKRNGTELKWVCRRNRDFDWNSKHRDPSSWGGAGRLMFVVDGEAEQAAWFTLPKESEDPPLYFVSDFDWDDEESGTRKVYDSFSDFVLHSLKWEYQSALTYNERKL